MSTSDYYINPMWATYTTSATPTKVDPGLDRVSTLEDQIKLLMSALLELEDKVNKQTEMIEYLKAVANGEI